jgi:hypothetical protein
MLRKNLLYLLGGLIFILVVGQAGQTQTTPELPLKKKNCGDLWPVEQDNKWGYIDKTGRLIIPFRFDNAGNFSEDLAAVVIKERTGYIDKTGKFIIPPQSYLGHSFSEGLAMVVVSHENQQRPYNVFEYGYIDKTGKMVIPLKKAHGVKWLSFYAKTLAFSEGLAGTGNEKMGFIDKTGRLVIPRRYNHVEAFSAGLAAVRLKERFGYIDRSGKLVIRPRFQEAGAFSEGLAPVCLSADEEKWGYIDTSGKLVIPGAFAWARGFSEGLAAVRDQNDKYGYIDKSGRFVIPPQFNHAGDFSEGLAAVVVNSDVWPGNLAYINPSGQVVIKSMSTVPSVVDKEGRLRYYRFCGGVARVGLGKKAGPDDGDADDDGGYINREGKIIWSVAPPAQKAAP